MYSQKKNYITEQHSDGKSKISRRWKVDIKETVNNYDFTFQRAYADCGETCDFCGNKLKYVAEIEGRDLKHPDTGIYKMYSIGFDCLQLVFGRDWIGYYAAKKSIDDLKKAAAQERRRKDYAERYEDIIKWLNSISQEFVNNNGFLRDMKHILTTGSKVFSVNMEGGLRQFMSKHKYSAEEYEKKIKHFKENTLPKLNMVYQLVCRVDSITPGTPREETSRWSSYGFVSDVYYKAKQLNKVSPSQLEHMNKVYERYIEKEEKLRNKNSIEYVDTSKIPF